MTSITSFAKAERRFGHIHLSFVEPLPVFNNSILLTCVDRFTHWPEAWSVGHISAQTVAPTLVTNWIAHFEIPDIITTDQGCLFESKLLFSLVVSFGIRHIYRHRPAGQQNDRALTQDAQNHANHA